MAELVLVFRSLGSPSGGGISSHILAFASQLAPIHEVTLLSAESNGPLLEQRFAAEANVRVETIELDDSTDYLGFENESHAWSAAVYVRLRELYSDTGGPDYIEFPDYRGEALVTVQAKKTRDPMLENTIVAIGLAPTRELRDVLNGSESDELPVQMLYDAERYALANADWLVCRSGDVYATYQRFYGDENLAPAWNVSHVSVFDSETEGALLASTGETLRILFAGRLERRKGIHNLVEALARSPLTGWSLTIVGEDTGTGPLLTSMRNLLERTALGDPRIEIRDAVDQSEIPALIREHDVLISPSLWDCGPAIALEALVCNRPVLATPVGGHTALAQPDVCGMLAEGTTSGNLHQLVERAVGAREHLRQMIETGGPARRARELTASCAENFRRLLAEPRPPLVELAPELPLVSVVIPYYRMHEFIEQAVQSVRAQTYANVELVIVNDGSFEPEDEILERMGSEYGARVLTTLNGGVGAARNFGIRQCRGEYVIPLDSDNVLRPGYIDRTVRVLRSNPEYPYVTSWLRHVQPNLEPYSFYAASHPISNAARSLHRRNIAGDAVATFRRSTFDEVLRMTNFCSATKTGLFTARCAQPAESVMQSRSSCLITACVRTPKRER